MTSNVPVADDRTEDLESIISRAEALAKEVETMRDCPRRQKLKNALAAMLAIADQFRAGVREED